MNEQNQRGEKGEKEEEEEKEGGRRRKGWKSRTLLFFLSICVTHPPLSSLPHLSDSPSCPRRETEELREAFYEKEVGESRREKLGVGGDGGRLLTMQIGSLYPERGERTRLFPIHESSVVYGHITNLQKVFFSLSSY